MKPTASIDIATIYQHAYMHGLAFAAYRLPDTIKIQYLTGTSSHKLKAGQSAFAFVPFDPDKKPIYIKSTPPPSLPEGEEQTALSKRAIKKSTSKKQYTDLVKKMIGEIRSGHFKKIVAARVLAVSRPDLFDPVAFFKKLCTQYPGAFVSLVYIRDMGLWIGASPEVLVSETPAKLITYSLAGTKAINDDTEWSDKEREEQKIVTDFILKKLDKKVNDKITIKGPVTHNAGSLKHLLSVFTVNHRGKSIWKKVAKTLHPTPAVGGMPQHKAAKFISMHESFDRVFYAGYLGPVNQDGRTDLFVNLRCMQVTDKQLLFYAGCGVTVDSDPGEEWQESERKIDVLRSLIDTK